MDRVIKLLWFFIITALILFNFGVPVAYSQVTKPVVVIDPGHGRINDDGTLDPGAVSGDLVEKDINLDVAKQTRQLLTLCPVDVLLTREGDDLTHTLGDVDEIVNGYRPTLGIAIHVNSAGLGATGTETWHTVGGYDDAKSQHLSRLLVNSIAQQLSLANRGIKPETSNRHKGLYIHWWNAPSALVELAFLQGDDDLLRDGRPLFARAISEAILTYLNIPLDCLSADQGSVTATVLVIDVSGSMGNDWQGGVKIESAQSAANQIVNMIEQESQVGGISHRLGLVSFSSDASLEMGLSVDYDQIRTTIARLHPLDKTNIGAGLIVANEALARSNPDESRAIILLSDGMTNVGLAPAEIISGPVQEAINAHTCIYTVGFGDSGDIDEELLRRIASASGCGQYYFATDVVELERVYIRIRHASTGVILADISGTVSQGETAQAGTFDVPAGEGELAVSLHWQGSQLDLHLKDPADQEVNQNYPGAEIRTYADLVYALIENPLAGKWEVNVFGRDVPERTLDYNFIASARVLPLSLQPTPAPSFTMPIPTSGGFSLGFLLLILAVAGVAVYAFAQAKAKAKAQPPQQIDQVSAQLIAIAGVLNGHVVTVSTTLLVGRGSACHLRLADPSVSRQHACLRYSQGSWFIQDMGSRGGTYVNGQRTQATRLNPGDYISIGGNTFLFQHQ